MFGWFWCKMTTRIALLHPVFKFSQIFCIECRKIDLNTELPSRIRKILMTKKLWQICIFSNKIKKTEYMLQNPSTWTSKKKFCLIIKKQLTYGRGAERARRWTGAALNGRGAERARRWTGAALNGRGADVTSRGDVRCRVFTEQLDYDNRSS